MQRCWATLITIVIAMLIPAAATRSADEPPSLGRDSAVNAIVATLEDEVESMRPGSDEREAAIVARAGITLRIIALELITLGRDQPDGAIAVMAGWSLAESRHAVDAVLRDAIDDGRLTTAQHERLATFADEMVAALHELDLSPPGLDRGLKDLLEPLADVIAALEETSIANHWVELPSDDRVEQQPTDDAAPLEHVQQQLLNDEHAADVLDEQQRVRVRGRLEQLREDFGHPGRRAEARRRLAVMADLAQLVDAAGALRRFDRDDLPRSWRAIDGRMDDARRRLDERVFRTIDRVLARDDVADNADLRELHAAQQRLLADRRRLRRVEGWIDSVRAVNAPAARHVERELRILARDLARPDRRDDAARTLDQFEHEVRWLDAFAFETALRRDSELAQTVTHGRPEALLDTLNDARLAWTETWADGDAASAAAARLKRMARLMTALGELAEPAVDEDRFEPLERWAGWTFASDLLEIERRRLLGRLKLAIAHAVNGERVRLNNHLEAIETSSGTIRLGEALLVRLGPALDDLPAGATGRLSRIMRGPDADSAFAEHREMLAQLGWMTREADHARALGDDEAMHRLNDWHRSRTSRLLEAVQPAPTRRRPNR